MKAYAIRKYGKGERLHLTEFPEPELRPGDVMIEIHAASVNPVDFKIRDALRHFEPNLAHRPLEVSVPI